jgi:hypothetical protein
LDQRPGGPELMRGPSFETWAPAAPRGCFPEGGSPLPSMGDRCEAAEAGTPVPFRAVTIAPPPGAVTRRAAGHAKGAGGNRPYSLPNVSLRSAKRVARPGAEFHPTPQSGRRKHRPAPTSVLFTSGLSNEAHSASSRPVPGRALPSVGSVTPVRSLDPTEWGGRSIHQASPAADRRVGPLRGNDESSDPNRPLSTP